MQWVTALRRPGRHVDRPLYEGFFFMPPTRHLTPAQKERILERDAYVCAYCQGDATVVDHIIPWSWCYDDSEHNLVAACADCNAIAGDKMFGSFTEKWQYIVARRAGKKWTRKLKEREPITCTMCGRFFHPYVGYDATMFLCNDCSDACKNLKTAEEQEKFASGKRKAVERGDLSMFAEEGPVYEVTPVQTASHSEFAPERGDSSGTQSKPIYY